MSEPAIAREIGICQNTLRKHFADELRAGNEIELAANLRRLRKAADKGNVTAMKHMDARFSVVAAHKSFVDEPAPSEKPSRLGKKEAATMAAATAGVDTPWGDDLNPPSGALRN
jgi:hypothetical protein